MLELAGPSLTACQLVLRPVHSVTQFFVLLWEWPGIRLFREAIHGLL